MAGAAFLGEADVDPASIHVTHGTRDQPVALEAGDDPRERALAEVGRLRELLHTVELLAALDQAVEHLELAYTQPMTLAQLSLQRAPGRCMAPEQLAPGFDEGALSWHEPELTMHRHKIL